MKAPVAATEVFTVDTVLYYRGVTVTSLHEAAELYVRTPTGPVVNVHPVSV
ncbi:MAG: hypothetical protein JWM49_1855 [Microbacteriaceae bacterium]|nr:hypothetical protein [Microbacteriaceae bacterium]